MRRFLAALFLVGLMPVVAAGSGTDDTDVKDHPWIGKPAPAIELPTVDGKTWSLSSVLGKKYVVIHFAASW
jgi:hypothetical protein